MNCKICQKYKNCPNPKQKDKDGYCEDYLGSYGRRYRRRR